MYFHRYRSSFIPNIVAMSQNICQMKTVTRLKPFTRWKSNVIDQNIRSERVENLNSKSLHSEPLPFESIPEAGAQRTPSLAKFQSISIQIKQLLSGKWDSKFHEHVDDFHNQLGPIFRKSIGPVEAVFIKSPELIRDIFHYEGKYPKHPLPEAWIFYNQLHNCKRGLFFMDDAEWLETRKQLAPLMLRNEKRFSAAVESASDELISNWKQYAISHHKFTELPHPLTSLYGWSIRVLIGIMFGRAANEMYVRFGKTIDHFARIVQNVFEDTVPFQTISPRTARGFRLNIWSKFEASVSETLKIAKDVVDFGIDQNHCDGLLREMQGLGMSREMIQRIFIDLIIAAGDTTAFSTQWALYLLSQNFQMQSIIRKELLANDKWDTSLIRGTVRETLRLFPVATFIGRILNKDAILNNYRVNENTLVLISMYSAGRDENSFPEANAFVPWRWNRDSNIGALKAVNHAQSSIPYALGARNCIGQRIANTQMYVILAKLLRSFEIHLLNANEIDIVMRLIIMPSKNMRFAIRKI